MASPSRPARATVSRSRAPAESRSHRWHGLLPRPPGGFRGPLTGGTARGRRSRRSP
jgi:hypothetical protein